MNIKKNETFKQYAFLLIILPSLKNAIACLFKKNTEKSHY
jgi:hypothetical protein